MKSVLAVIVTWNRLPLLQQALASIRAQTYRDMDILVVDNGSTDGTAGYLDALPDVQVIHQENSGGAGGFHSGLKYAVQKGYVHAWLMDDDVIPSAEALQALMDTRETLGPGTGFVCSKVTGPGGMPLNLPAIDLSRGVNGYQVWIDKLEHAAVRVRYATFVSVLIPCRIVREVGLPLKEFFIWGDDSEFTQRIGTRYPSYVIGTSLVVHLRTDGASLNIDRVDDPDRLPMLRYLYRNHVYIRRYGDGGSRKQAFRYRRHILIKAVKFLLRGKWIKASVLFRALAESFTFHPKIEFPD